MQPGRQLISFTDQASQLVHSKSIDIPEDKPMTYQIQPEHSRIRDVQILAQLM